jgi:hypothetical protein
MPRACLNSETTVDRIERLLEAVKEIDAAELERLVQLAHECSPKQMAAPPEPLPVTRQALRMFWHFRCNLESVEVTADRG